MRHDAHYVDELAQHRPTSVGRLISVDQIDPNPDQPRIEIGDLDELTASIRERGVLEPLLVKPIRLSDRWMIIAGERRWRAAREAGLRDVPCIEMDVDDRAVAEIPFIENMQRKDLTPWEEADGLKALCDKFGYTHDEVARKVGKSRSTVTEAMSVANLPADTCDRPRNVNVPMKPIDKGGMSRSHSVESEDSSANAPGNWTQIQRSLAASTGLSLLLVEGHEQPAIEISNNNTICDAFQSSDELSHLCKPYCGAAFNRAWESAETIHYRCHLGLQCIAAPVRIEGSKPYAIIGGRAFLRTADYRAVAERMRAGDLQALVSDEVFRNVIFASSGEIADLPERIGKAVREFASDASLPQPLPEVFETLQRGN
jgi:ParB/RepB/Spo0J family partition protein